MQGETQDVHEARHAFRFFFSHFATHGANRRFSDVSPQVAPQSLVKNDTEQTSSHKVARPGTAAASESNIVPSSSPAGPGLTVDDGPIRLRSAGTS